jgi:choline kinase/thiamine kinase-like enzyme
VLSKVCILTAGSGTRMGPYSKTANKALLPWRNKAIISHIVENFEQSTEYIVAVGFKAQQVKSYLKLAHPDRKFTFVEVENYQNSGCGPGLSMLACKEVLSNSPFYLVTCDTLWQENLQTYPTDESWLAVGKVTADESPSYCNIILQQNRVLEIRDKVKVLEAPNCAWTGLAYIYHTNEFWNSLQNYKNVRNPEKQVVDGFYGIEKLNAYPVKWIDTGTFEKYRQVVAADGGFDFGKTDEFVYINSNKVIKFFSDKRTAADRVTKAYLNSFVFPKITDIDESFYAYTFQKGKTLYEEPSIEVFTQLMVWLNQNLWIKKTIDTQDFTLMCQQFYYAKTVARLKKYLDLGLPEAESCNGQDLPKALDLVNKIEPNLLSSGESYFIHGDLQPDNILFLNEAEGFKLIDWRQDFAGCIELGDLYYDFAKMLAGLKINYQLIKKGDFEFSMDGAKATVRVPQHPNALACEKILKTWAEKFNLDFNKIEIICGLIFLNMSSLHYSPFNQVLNVMGRKVIQDCLSKSGQ